MSWVGVGVAVVGAVSSESNRQSARRAGEQQKDAAKSAQNTAAAQLKQSQRQQRPFRQSGVRALGQQEALLGIGGQEEQQQAFAAFSQSPGQQFLRDQQERSLLRNASAIGGLGGGNVRAALQQQAFGRAQTDFGNQFNRLGTISGAGQAATQNIGQLGAQAAGNIGQLQLQEGAARASGVLGQSQARQQGLSDILGIAAQSGAFNQNQPAPTQQTNTLNQPQQFQA